MRNTHANHNGWMTAAAVGIGAGLALYGLSKVVRPTYSFAGRTVVITGGSRGLGLVMARRLAAEGANLALLARNGDELDRAAVELAERTQVIPIVCDVTEQEQVDRAVDQVVRRFGRVDVLINNAGTIQCGPFEHMTVEDFREAVEMHLYAPLYATLAALPWMRRQGGGRIVNISSIGGKVPVPHLMPYCASKFALVGFSETLRAELMKDGVVVTTVCPGLMRTGSPPNAFFKGRHRAEYALFTIGDGTPGLSMSAERAAARVVEACRQGRARVVLGAPAKAAVLLHEAAPQTYARLMALLNRLLPPPTPERETARYTGWESQSGWAPSPLTALSDRATRRNNESKPQPLAL